MPRGAEPGHVSAGLGDDDLRGGLAHAGDGGQLLKLAGKRAHLFLDPGRQFEDRGGELVDALQVQPTQKGMVLTEVPGQRLDQLGDLGTHPGPGHLGQHVHVTFTLDQRTEHRPPRDPEDVGGYRGEFDPGSNSFSNRWASRVRSAARVLR